MTDPESMRQKSQELEERLLVVAAASVVHRKTMYMGFAILVGLLLLVLGGIVGVTLDTNQTQETQVIPLQKRVADLEETVADQEAIINQQTDAIVLLITTLQENGINPPEIIIRSPED